MSLLCYTVTVSWHSLGVFLSIAEGGGRLRPLVPVAELDALVNFG